MKIAAIIPAYNEERGIGDVLKAVCKAKLPNEIIVVSDGSKDRTVEIAKSFGVKVLEHFPNKGKAAAMLKGVSATDADTLLFIDADLVGLTSELVDSLIKPIIEDRAEVTMGLFAGGKFSTDLAQKIFPFLTGQRAMKRNVWEGAKVREDSQYGVEVYVTRYMAKHNVRVENILLKGCTQLFKEQKGQAVHGFGQRLKMVFDIAKAMFAPEEKPKKHKSNKVKTIKISTKLYKKERNPIKLLKLTPKRTVGGLKK